MTKYKLGILTNEGYVLNALKLQLKGIFGSNLEIEGLYMNCKGNKKMYSNVILFTDEIVLGKAKNKKIIPPNAKLIKAERNISIEKTQEIKRLLEIKFGTKVAVCNNSYEIAVKVTSMLKDIGIKNLELIPYSRNVSKDLKDVTTAITFGVLHIIPPNMEEVIDLGFRTLDINTIIKIIQCMNMNDIEINMYSYQYYNTVMKIAYDMARTSEYLSNINSQLQGVFSISQDALILSDSNYKIILFNKCAETLFKDKKKIAKGKYIKEIIPDISKFISNFSKESDRISNMISIEDKKYLIFVNCIDNKNLDMGYVILFHEMQNIQNMEMRIRQELYKKDFRAKYRFQDIIRRSSKINKLINYAERISKTSYSILITGESGTGKEMFAQAIHNNSYRANGPFIPINVASLNDSLIESELFGYAEGAFTGAKKNGKPGLFELAHSGTIFLDEISELSLPIQSKLLRVIQEREVVRVGGIKTIPVDIRIIVASNRNLLEMVKKRAFREDLYYRINVLPITIPPLRARPDDIIVLMDYYLDKHKISKKYLSDYAQKCLMEYDWPGNVRELENICTYIACLIDINEIDENMINEKIIEYITYNKNNSKPSVKNADKNFDRILNEEQYTILEEVYLSNKMHEKVGRKSISERLKSRNIFLTEQEVRKYLNNLRDLSFVIINKGRAGTKITSMGIEFIERMK